MYLWLRTAHCYEAVHCCNLRHVQRKHSVWQSEVADWY